MKDTDNKDAVAIPDEDKGAEDDDSDSDKFGFWQAFGFNTMMMFGTGPFISIPYTVSSIDPTGPHALVGYSIALVVCICDSLICGELGSMPPYWGGSATYLRYLYGKNSLGQLMSFMFLYHWLQIRRKLQVASSLSQNTWFTLIQSYSDTGLVLVSVLELLLCPSCFSIDLIRKSGGSPSLSL